MYIIGWCIWFRLTVASISQSFETHYLVGRYFHREKLVLGSIITINTWIQQPCRFSGSSLALDAGQCSYKTKATGTDSGQWRCHIGRKGSIGLEIMQIINVRVVKHLAAIEPNITTVHGKEVTLACATVKGLAPLRYCRFEPPTGKPFSINSDVTRD